MPGTISAARLAPTSSTSITHGAGNTMLTLTGTNFLPGVDVALQDQQANGASFISLTVRDYGSGVSLSDLVSVFQPFYRAAEARDRASGGAGLGLAIAERVIRIRQRTISAENVPPHGLQINIALPRE